jgi:hypothetical protein
MKFTHAVKLKKNGLLQKIPASKYFVVQDEFEWYLSHDEREKCVVVEKGFKTDFGSIPMLFQFVFSPTRYVAYILHDRLYKKDSWIHVKGNPGGIFSPTRKISDQILREALKVEGMSFLGRWIVYIAVRAFGFWGFRKDMCEFE